ncbi:uncharacterized protein LOC126621021 [Malus sylvestris]|uniref:uncharacterized protein LOC126621021 n=1 Tax=Malus sylvestris TaxID=3752 RepID=UPI0021AC8A57|nr:uncharacterized protein LOC126621021 [Malus sylvestris]
MGKEMNLIGIRCGQMNVPEFQYEYQVIVGIAWDRFIHLLVHLQDFGLTVYVCVTDSQVAFIVANEDAVLTKEVCMIPKIQFPWCLISTTFMQCCMHQLYRTWSGCSTSPMVQLSC